jgi:lysophospholipase L1-like esterase
VHQDYGFGPYYEQRKSLFKILPQHSSDILFIGHSLLDGCEWSELLENSNIKNRGINGEIIKGVLTRIDEITQIAPAKIFLMIGTNDMDYGFKVDEILQNHEKIIAHIRQKCPETTLYLLGMLPVFKHLRHQVNAIPENFNSGLLELANKYNCNYVDLYHPLQDSNGHLVENYSNDGWHLMGEGYLKLKEVFWPLVNA